MDDRPTLQTDRLILRPFRLADAAEVQRLAGDSRVAEMTANIPHPYEDGMAEEWIGGHAEAFSSGRRVSFAIVRRSGSALVGAIGLVIEKEHDRAGLGYWIGVPYWNQGYCTEAAWAVLRYGFGSLSLSRIHSGHIARNPASGRVMLKIGMTREGYLRRHIRCRGRTEDLVVYGILRDEVVDEANSTARRAC